MMKPLGPVTAVVLHFRTPAKTLDCLESLHREGVSRVVLVDNSADGGASIAAIRAELNALSEAGLFVQLVSAVDNLGFSRGVALGVENALNSGPVDLLLLNSDAKLEPGSLALLAQSESSADIVVPRVRRAPGEKLHSLIGYYHRSLGLVLERPVQGAIRYPSGCCMLIRSSYFPRRLFDLSFFFYGEDVELGAFLERQGVSFGECRKAAIVHSGSGSAKNGSLFYEYHINRGHWLLGSKLAKTVPERLIFLAGRCLSLPLRAVLRSTRLRSWAPIHGLIAASVDVIQGKCRSFTPPLTEQGGWGFSHRK